MLKEVRDISASIWISASAGSGKTKNLIDRILSLLLQNVSPQKILCLTYTKAAAAEMLERLSNYLQKISRLSAKELALELNCLGFNDVNIELARDLYIRSLDISNWVQIKTIHSFCFDIIDKFPLESGVLPGVKIMDEYEKKSIFEEAIKYILSDKKNDNFWNAISDHSGRVISDMRDALSEIDNFIYKIEDLNKEYCDFFNIETLIPYEKLEQTLIKEIFGKDIYKNLDYCSIVLMKGGKTDIKNAEILKKSIENKDADFIKVFLTDKYEIRKRLFSKSIFSNDFFEIMQLIAENSLRFLELLRKHISLKKHTAFFSLTEQLASKIKLLKEEKHLIDFEDIIAITSNLLNQIEWVMYKIDGGVDHLLIDEAQDTSKEQWEIIRKISDEFFSNYQTHKTVFVVGDEKQSIYSFQGADVNLFFQMQKYFRKRSEINGQKFYNVNLTKSYRTLPNILSFVDSIFVEDFENNKHISHRNNDDGVVEIIDLFENDAEKEEQPWGVVDSSFLQNADMKKSQYVAKLISEHIKKRTFIPSKNRGAKPSDFMLLFQRRNLFIMQQIVNELQKYGIKTNGIDKIILKNEHIIKDLIVVAKFALCPFDDLSCAIFLKSSIVGISENELMDLCLSRKEKNLWQYICEEKNIYKKYSLSFVKDFFDWTVEKSAYDFFICVLNYEIKEKLINFFGSESLKIVNAFMDIVLNFGKTNNASLEYFIKWFEEFDHEIKLEKSSEEDSVNLMTSHASKGLQSPFVFLMDSDFQKPFKDSILKTDDGLLIWDFDSSMRTKKINDLYQKKYENITIKESKRLLYVAMTRAEDFLYILGNESKNTNKNCWYNIILNNFDVSKFSEIIRDNHKSIIYGSYKYHQKSQMSDEIDNICNNYSIPSWINKKYEGLSYEKNDKEEKNQAEIYGEAVHLLLSETPNLYKNNIDLYHPYSWKLLEKFDLSDDVKKIAKLEAENVISNENFSFIFNEESLSESIISKNGEQYRLDKIAFYDGWIWIIDFKTGEQQEQISANYREQLLKYRAMVQESWNVDNIKMAILWTRNMTLLEVV